MNDFKNSAMIALLPITTEWCHIELPHMTLVYAGEIDDLKPSSFNELAKDAASLAMLSRPITLNVTGVDVFGEEDRVNVFTLRANSELLAMRRAVEHWNASKFPFNPHATIGPIGTMSQDRPSHLAFDRIMVGWGNEILTFWLKR